MHVSKAVGKTEQSQMVGLVILLFARSIDRHGKLLPCLLILRMIHWELLFPLSWMQFVGAMMLVTGILPHIYMKGLCPTCLHGAAPRCDSHGFCQI